MSKCKWNECENDVVSTGNRVKEFCSDGCRMKFNRSNANAQPEQIESEHQPEQRYGEQSMDDVNPDGIKCGICQRHATRTNPDTLNTGPYLTGSQLERAGLKANRVPIPGDSDYQGVCEQQGGVWQVRKAS